jgi:rare lipoprotein A
MLARAGGLIFLIFAVLLGFLVTIVLHADLFNPSSASAEVERGLASWYGPGCHGKRTASGETYNQLAMTAAHRQLPLGTRVTVTDLNNGRQVEVETNDRGPSVGGRIIDLSKAAARQLHMARDGIAPARIEAADDAGR